MARSFNGSSDEVDIGNIAILKPASLTISVWCNPTDFVNSYAGVVTNYSGSGTGIFVRTDGKPAFYSGSVVDPFTATLTAGTWAHLAGTASAGIAQTAYFNGAPAGTGSATGPVYSTDMKIGMVNTRFKGSIADVAMWSVVLTASEIAALAAGARPHRIRTASLVGYWPLDGIQSPEPDLSGNANSGTLTGTALAAGPPITLSTQYKPAFEAAAVAADAGFGALLSHKRSKIIHGGLTL